MKTAVYRECEVCNGRSSRDFRQEEIYSICQHMRCPILWSCSAMVSKEATRLGRLTWQGTESSPMPVIKCRSYRCRRLRIGRKSERKQDFCFLLLRDRWSLLYMQSEFVAGTQRRMRRRRRDVRYDCKWDGRQI